MTAPVTGAYFCFVGQYLRVDSGESAEVLFHKNDTQQNSMRPMVAVYKKKHTVI